MFIPCSQKIATGLCPERDEKFEAVTSYALEFSSTLFHLVGLFPSGFPTKILAIIHTFLSSSVTPSYNIKKMKKKKLSRYVTE
jgi:hypothetical membrane protein